MAKLITEKTYRKLNLSADKIKEISVTPKVKGGKLLFNKKDKSHRYVIDDK